MEDFVFSRSASYGFVLLFVALASVGCERSEERARQQVVRGTTSLPREVESLDATAQDLFVTGPLLEELIPRQEVEGRSPLEVTEFVVKRIRSLREARGLALSSAGRPGGARHSHELARLLLAPSPILETDAPTTDLELVALAVVALDSSGVKASPAVRVNAGEGDQLEHVVLAARVDGDGAPPRFFELTDARLQEEAKFETITRVEALGLHHARLAGLLFMLNQLTRSEQELELSLSLAPDLATPHYVRAMRDAQLHQSPERILADLSKVSLHKEGPEIWLAMGRALRSMKKFERAQQMFALIEEESSSHAIAQQEMAMTACHEGETDAFFEHVTKARSSDPLLWEAHRDAALVALSTGRDALFSQAVRDGQRVQPALAVWDLLLGASSGDALAQRELDARRQLLGACAHHELSPPMRDQDMALDMEE